MKILHIMPMLGVGGASRLLSEITPLMNKQDETAFLINKVANDAFLKKFIDGGVKVHSLQYPRIHSPWNIFKIARHLKNYDVVHVHLFPSIYWVALANLFARKPLVYTEHSTYNKRRAKAYLKPIERWVYGRYKKIISISDLTEKNLKEWLGAKNHDKRFVVINNGVNLSEFKVSKHEKLYPHTLIMVARFVPAKDHITIIKAMTLLGDDVHLIFVGDGETRNSCQSLVNELGVEQRVHFVGLQSDVANWIGKADIGIQSSNWEGFGLTAVEMMAGGLPVVASDVDGLRQVVEGAGVLFPCGDHKKLAEEIKKLLADKLYYEEVKSKCQERSNEYDIKQMVNSYLTVYKEVLNQK